MREKECKKQKDGGRSLGEEEEGKKKTKGVAVGSRRIETKSCLLKKLKKKGNISLASASWRGAV